MEGNIYQCQSKDPIYRLEQEMRIRKFSPRTTSSYLYCNKELLRFASKFAKEINSGDIKDYLDFLVRSHKSTSTLNLAINAFKFYYGQILNRSFFISAQGIKRPKKDKKLPTVLAKEEILAMISVADNIKHKLMIQILYSSGLRVSELMNLKIIDIDFFRKIIIVKGGKGKKDRITISSEQVLKNIEKYLLEYKPLKYLFEGYNDGEKLNVRTVQKVVEKIAKKAGIKKNVSAHALRHSFATHLLEKGVNLRYIQSLLGHTSLETTQIYTRVASSQLEEIESLL